MLLDICVITCVEGEQAVKILCAHDEMRDIDSLVLNPRNNNIHPESQIERLAKIIRYTGFRSPVVVSKRSGFVVKGHGRIEAARKLGLTQVPVDLQDYDDEAQEWADMIADNKIASYAEFDEALTKEILKDIEASGLDIENTGFSAEDANAILAEAEAIQIGDDHEADDLPERNAKAIVKLGDLIELGDHRLICGDSTDKATIERLMQGERAKLFATDPPYLVSYEGEEWDEKDTEANKDLYFRFIDIAIKCAIEKNAAFYCWHASARVDILLDAWRRHNVLNHNQIIWVKPAPTIGRSWYLWRHEPCLMGWIQGNKPDRTTGEYLNTAWEINRGKDNPDATPVESDETKSLYSVRSTVWFIEPLRGDDHPDHPTPKPLECFAIPMRQHTNKGDIVYEPFCGSGSQLIAAEKLGRKCYAAELSPAYCDIAIQRYLELGNDRKAVINGKDKTKNFLKRMELENAKK